MKSQREVPCITSIALWLNTLQETIHITTPQIKRSFMNWVSLFLQYIYIFTLIQYKKTFFKKKIMSRTGKGNYEPLTTMLNYV